MGIRRRRDLMDSAQQLFAGTSGVRGWPGFPELTVVMGMCEHRYENNQRLSPPHRYSHCRKDQNRREGLPRIIGSTIRRKGMVIT